jgi:hypothetical protein
LACAEESFPNLGVREFKRTPRPHETSKTDELKQQRDCYRMTKFGQPSGSEIEPEEWPPEHFRSGPDAIEYKMHHHSNGNTDPSATH